MHHVCVTGPLPTQSLEVQTLTNERGQVGLELWADVDMPVERQDVGKDSQYH